MNNWYDKARSALFVHWGINTENPDWEKRIPRFKTCEEFEAAVADWSAEKWVSAARKLRASYITLAIFHSCLGYMKAWKSKIPGTYTTKRDFLGELIEEANKYNIKILLYISGDSSGHLFYKDYPWVFPEEYNKYKNDNSINILDFGVWQTVYAKEIIGEVIDNYPDLAGFWFDGWNRDKVNKEIFEFIHKKNPKLINIKNNFTDYLSDGEDVMSLECFGKKYSPSFDYPSSTWVPPHGRECCYVMSELSDWWQFYEPKEFDRNELLRKFITITTNGWVAKMGLGPNLAGDFNGHLGKFINDIDSYLAWAEESIFDTAAGGVEIGYQNDGAYITGCYRADNYFIHTLLPPKGDVIIVADGGNEYESAKLLNTNKPLEFEQKDGLIYIKAPFNEYCEKDADAVVVLKKLKSKIVKKITTAEYLKTLPTETLIENNDEIEALILHEDDSSSITSGGWAAPENNRAKDYTVLASDDGKNYKELKKGTFLGARGDKQINFVPTKAKFIKLRIENAHNTTEGYLKKFVGLTWEYLPKNDDMEPKSEVMLGNNKYICDKDGNVCGWGDNGNNVYIIGCNAKGVSMSEDEKLLAVMPEEKGKLRIKAISLSAKN